jgi:hypothetical protein
MKVIIFRNQFVLTNDKEQKLGVNPVRKDGTR